MPNVITLKEAISEFSGQGPLAAKLRKAATNGLFSAALRAKSDIVTREITKLGAQRPIDRGIYRAGWQVARLPNGAAIYNSVPHASFIEYGVPAANVVISNRAIAAVSEWVKRKLGGTTNERQIAHAILRSMKKRGIFNRGRGLRILETYSRTILPKVVLQEVEREIAKVAR
jgi:hypothetical protein